MATTNPITGDSISTRFGDKETQDKFNNNFDAIFGVKPKKEKYVPPLPLNTDKLVWSNNQDPTNWNSSALPLNEYPDNSSDEWDEARIDVISQNGNLGLHYD